MDLKQIKQKIAVMLVKIPRITAPEVARALGLSERMARVLVKKWVGDGWLDVAYPSRRKRAYKLTAIYRQCRVRKQTECERSNRRMTLYACAS